MTGGEGSEIRRLFSESTLPEGPAASHRGAKIKLSVHLFKDRDSFQPRRNLERGRGWGLRARPRPHILKKCFLLEKKSPSQPLATNTDCTGVVKPRGGVITSESVLCVVLETILSAAGEQVQSQKKLNSAPRGK